MTTPPPTADSRFPRKDSETRQQRSRTIPLPRSHIARTRSELQLSEDMAAAEWQDLCMFYRVVGGIREQQQQCSSGGAAILKQHRPPQHLSEHKPVRDWTGKDVSAAVDTAARVTPFETTSSPPQDPPYPQSLLLTSPTRRSSDGGGWSITGFDEDPQDTSQLALIEQDACDDAVFVMDL